MHLNIFFSRFLWLGFAHCSMLMSVRWPSWMAKLTLCPPCGLWAWDLCWMQCLNSVRSWVPWGWSPMRWPSSWLWCSFLQVRKGSGRKCGKAVRVCCKTIHELISNHWLNPPLCFSDRSGISDMEGVEQLQEGLIRALRSLISRRRPDDSSLFPKLLLRLPDLRTLNNLHSDKLLAFRIDP